MKHTFKPKNPYLRIFLKWLANSLTPTRHDYLAIKRFSCWTNIVYGIQSFKPIEWGNLFFLDRELLDKAKANIVDFIQKHEQSEYLLLQEMYEDREKKERVIQQLLSDQLLVNNPNFLNNFLNSDGLNE